MKKYHSYFIRIPVIGNFESLSEVQNRLKRFDFSENSKFVVGIDQRTSEY